MPLAIDTILAAAVNPGAGGAVCTTTASGDSLTVRNSNSARKAYLENIIRAGTTAGFSRVRSPMLHDNVFGIQITPNESPSIYSIPAEADQVLQPQDNLVVEMSGGAAETDLTVLQVYYEDLPGISARLHDYASLAGNIANIKPLRVAVTSSATIGAWTDTGITTTENILKAATDYAVLGYMTSSALTAVCLKGSETGNLRIGGPGTTQEFPTSDYFILMNQRNNRPWVPVFNSANAGNTFVSVAANTASVAATVTLILAQLATSVTP